MTPYTFYIITLSHQGWHFSHWFWKQNFQSFWRTWRLRVRLEYHVSLSTITKYYGKAACSPLSCRNHHPVTHRLSSLAFAAPLWVLGKLSPGETQIPFLVLGFELCQELSILKKSAQEPVSVDSKHWSSLSYSVCLKGLSSLSQRSIVGSGKE